MINHMIRILILFLLLLSLPGIAPAQTSEVTCTAVSDKKLRKAYDDGMEFLNKGNYGEAGIRMKNILKENPDFYEAYWALGYINYKRKNSNFKEAERNFLKQIGLCPDFNVYSYLYLAEINYGQEKYEDAVKYLNSFLADVEKIKSDDDYNRAESLLKYSKFYIEMIGHPVPFSPRVVEGISTPENEYLPIISPDNQMALFTREKNVGPDRDAILQTTSKTKEKFMFSLLDSSGRFTAGEEMPDPFNKNDNEGGATITIDNNTIYYTVCKNDKNSSYNNCDIFTSDFINGEWTPIRNVGSGINLPNSWESQPSISPDQNSLYFVSDREGGYGGYDIYKSQKKPDGEWGPAMNLGPVINTAGNEKAPFIHPDGKTLYFSSDGHMGLGGYDIFYSRLQENGSWSKPVNIGYPINSPENEAGFFVSTDGQTGYFTSNKYNGRGGYDLYSFPLYKEAQPQKVLFIKGNVKSQTLAEPVKARIELKNVENKKISEIPLDSITGNYVAVAPFVSDYIMTIKKEGFVYESKYLSKKDSALLEPSKIDIEIKPIEINKSYRINDIYFDFNSYELQGSAKIVLDQLIQWLSENMTISIQIQGHTDNIGGDADNLKLSENRAKAVFSYLITGGISPSRLSYKGYGKTMPVDSNDTEQGRAKNRRTVFVIVKK